ncbi:MAG: type II secretion system protein XpsI [Pseudomonadota bacterium]
MTRPRSASRRAAQRGYTLIEVVVAFGLLAFGMSLLLGSLSNASKQVRASDEYGRAALHAQSLLDQAGVGEALSVGRRDGELDGGRYRWEMAVAPYRDPGAPPRQPQALGAPQLLQLDLTVQWGEGGPKQRLHVRSLRLVTPTDVNAAGVVP